ncbi:MAG TPA: ion channel, partial [Hyphomicrobiales bacterium]|nr:ion channel [Hyphomicrobiales bacterium]
ELALIGFFVGASFLQRETWLVATELVIAALLVLDFLARWWMTYPHHRYFYKISTWTDLVVIGTLIIPVIAENLLFLRAVRVVRVFRSYHLLSELYENFTFFRKNRDAIEAALNLLVFIFVMSAVVYVLEVHRHPQINNFIDALYFTVSTLSTTGFGDITLSDTLGRLLSIGIMIVGVGLFVRLIQVIFRPSKVRHKCPTCGLTRHDPDAVHCKHCGQTLSIETEGDG